MIATQPIALKVKAAQQLPKIYIAEDHTAAREELTQIINRAGNLTVCGAAGVDHRVLAAIASTKPDLVLADVSSAGKQGLALIKKLRLVNRSFKLLVISTQSGALYAAKVLLSGGDGYIMKREDLDEIVYAIQDVMQGHIYISEEVMERTQGSG
jgi:DNA-binding NarL/FixJ family response regulator